MVRFVGVKIVGGDSLAVPMESAFRPDRRLLSIETTSIPFLIGRNICFLSIFPRSRCRPGQDSYQRQGARDGGGSRDSSGGLNTELTFGAFLCFCLATLSGTLCGVCMDD